MKKEIPWDLILGKLKNTLLPNQEIIFNQWLSQEGHRALFEELRLLWEKIQKSVVDYEPDTSYYWNELSKRIHSSKPQKSRVKIMSFYRYAAVASFLVLLTLSFYLGGIFTQPSPGLLSYSNQTGKSKITLLDGTEVCLHTNTFLTYQINQENDCRSVTLSGEAFFDVKHHDDIPFVVEVNGMKVVVYGTKFNVLAHPDSTYIYVSLQEGAVALKTDRECRMIKPGEMATFNRLNHQLDVEDSDVDYMSVWANDYIVFNGKPLGYICKLLSKWYNVKIDLEPSLADKYIYNFTLRNETLEEILRIMAQLNPIEYSFDDYNILSIRSKNRNLKY